MFNKP